MIPGTCGATFPTHVLRKYNSVCPWGRLNRRNFVVRFPTSMHMHQLQHCNPPFENTMQVAGCPSLGGVVVLARHCPVRCGVFLKTPSDPAPIFPPRTALADFLRTLTSSMQNCLCPTPQVCLCTRGNQQHDASLSVARHPRACRWSIRERVPMDV